MKNKLVEGNVLPKAQDIKQAHKFEECVKQEICIRNATKESTIFGFS